MNETAKFQKRYRIDSTRLAGWDYANPASYFVTICTKGRIPWFGHIRNGCMELSDVGAIADRFWNDIPAHFPHVAPDAHIVMPDHIHGIVRIGEKHRATAVDTPNLGVSTKMVQSWQSGCLGSIINQFKRACTYRIKCAGYPDFVWQSRFHDRIIRDADELQRIRHYIVNNPRNWHGHNDTF
jgi:putative transposase